MTVGVNCGHTSSGVGCGAVGIINESEQTRVVGYALMELLRDAGIEVVDCTIDKASSQTEYLANVVALANREALDWFISIHFNASPKHTGHGVEIYTYKGRQYDDVVEICANLASLGFMNRGVKIGSGLYVIRKTKAKSMLIEVCFCDNNKDVDIYNRVGRKVARAIFDGIYHYAVDSGIQQDDVREEFIEFVGEVAQMDWKKRKIMLPSVVIAQAIKESAFGTSELALEAKALFGIKKNGWTGKTYVKAATEQRPDGSFYIMDNTEWRAYDSWRESIIDHNNYIATRSTDGGRTRRYQPIIGCEDYRLVCQNLQDCGYATSINYAESLIKDYIEKYDLTKFDRLNKTCT